VNILAILFLGAAMMASDVPSSSETVPTALKSIGYVEAKLSDFIGRAGYEKRLSDPGGFLAAAADFRGDGHLDQARVLLNSERGIAYVVVVTVRDKIDTYVAKSVQLSEVDNLGIRIAAPARPNGVAAGLTVFALDGSGEETFDLVDDDFARRTSP
jgi:hypothetical protein